MSRHLLSSIFLLLILSCGCASEPAIDEQAYYEQGIEKLQALNYPAAMEAFLHAQKISEKTGNDSILLLTELSMTDLSDSICDTHNKVYHAIEACRLYERNKMYGHIHSIFDKLVSELSKSYPIEHRAHIMHYASIINDYDSILKVDNTTINAGKDLAENLIYAGQQHITHMGIAKGLKNLNINEYTNLIKSGGDWRRIITEDSTIISIQNAHMIASMLWDSNNDKEAGEFISFYRKYYKDKNIEYTLHPTTRSIIGHVKSYDSSWDKTLLMRTFQGDVNTIVTKFRTDEALINERAIHAQRLTIITLLSISTIIIITLILRFKIANMRRQRLEENNIRSAAELKNALSALEDTHIKTLTHLCNTYYDSYNNESIKSKIAKDALRAITEIAENEDFFTRIETRLNESENNLMFKIRSEMTELKESDCKLFICNAIGLSIPAICLVLGEKRDVIYARRLRLRAKIQESDAIDKETFLNHLK